MLLVAVDIFLSPCEELTDMTVCVSLEDTMSALAVTVLVVSALVLV